MGLCKAKEPMFPKELVRPASMVKSSANPFVSLTAAQDTPKATAYPLIEGRKGPFVAMLEVFKPAAKRTVDICDDDEQAVAIATWGLRPNGVSDSPQALLAGLAGVPLEVVSKKIKSFSRNRNVHQPGLFRMKAKPPFLGQLPQKVQGLLGLRLIATQNHQIIGVANHLVPSLAIATSTGCR